MAKKLTYFILCIALSISAMAANAWVSVLKNTKDGTIYELHRQSINLMQVDNETVIRAVFRSHNEKNSSVGKIGYMFFMPMSECGKDEVVLYVKIYPFDDINHATYTKESESVGYKISQIMCNIIQSRMI